MLQSLFEKVRQSGSEIDPVQSEQTLPDISRVIPLASDLYPAAYKPTPGTSALDAEDLGHRAEAAIEGLNAQFDAWMRRDLIKLIGSWTDVLAAMDDEQKARTLFLNAHNIRGVAGAYGYDAISRICGSLCRLLSNGTPRDHKSLINLHIESCRAVYAMVVRTGHTNEDAEAMCEALERHVNKKVADHSSAP